MLSNFLNKINCVMQSIKNSEDFGDNCLESAHQILNNGKFSSTPNNNLPRIFSNSVTPSK